MKQLRITACRPGLEWYPGGIPCVSEEEVIAHGGAIGKVEYVDAHRNSASMHESMEGVSPSRMPIVIDGDLQQCEEPVEKQDILLILPNGVTHKMMARLDPEDDDNYEFLLYKLEDAAPEK